MHKLSQPTFSEETVKSGHLSQIPLVREPVAPISGQAHIQYPGIGRCTCLQSITPYCDKLGDAVSTIRKAIIYWSINCTQ